MMILHVWLANLLGMYAEYTWIFHGVITFSVAFLAHWLTRKILKHFYRYCKTTQHVWDDTLLVALRLPLLCLIWVFAAAKFANYMLLDLQEKTMGKSIDQLHLVLNIVIILWFFWRYIDFLEKRLLISSVSNQKIDKTTVSIIGRLARIALIIMILLIVLNAFGIPLTGLVAFGGGGAIVMGIAAQQLLANWFGGLIIFLDKPFVLGDWIQSPDKDIEGKVTRIGWRTTEVISLDHRPLYIPNALFNQIIIKNPQRMLHRKIDVSISVRYEDAGLLKGLLCAIQSMLREHPSIDQNELIMANFVGFGDVGLNINVSCFSKFVHNPQWREVQQDIFFRIIELLREFKVELSSPSMIASIPDGVTIRQERNSL